MDTAELVSDHFMRLLNRVVFQVNATVRNCCAETVHDLRVSIRRFLQGLRVFRTCYAVKLPKKMGRFLKATLSAAGEVRDCDVALQLLETIEAKATRGLRQKLEARRKAASAALIERLQRWKQRHSSAKWRHGLQSAKVMRQDSRLAMEEVAHKILPARASQFLRCGEDAARPNTAAEQLHEFRIALKKFRYSLEAFTEMNGSGAAAWFEQLKRTQQLLGAVNDCRTARSVIASLGKHRKIETALKAQQDRKMREFRRFWAREFSSVTGGKWALALPTLTSRTQRKPAGSAQRAEALAATGA